MIVRTVNKMTEYHVVWPSAEQLEKARAEGAEEAWTFRNKAIWEMDSDEYRWYVHSPKIYADMTYAEAKAEFAKWKAAHKWEPKVGDIVECYGERRVLLQIIGDSAYVMRKTGSCGYCELENMSPTGEHIDLSPISKVLK